MAGYGYGIDGCGVGMGGDWGGDAGQLFHSCLVTFKTLSSLMLFRSAGRRRLDQKALWTFAFDDARFCENLELSFEKPAMVCFVFVIPRNPVCL